MSASSIFTVIVSRVQGHPQTSSYYVRDEWGSDLNDKHFRAGVIELEPDPDGYTVLLDHQGDGCERVKHQYRARLWHSAKTRRVATGLVQDMADDLMNSLQSTNDNMETNHVIRGQMRFEPIRLEVKKDADLSAGFNVVTGVLKFSVQEYQDPGAR
jgi:hypothetical protein